MNKIESFKVDHTKLDIGMYISRVDDDITTFDIRMKKPNNNDYLTNASIHTIEHIFATFVRNTKYEKNIIYVGPMGCRTGFYFITRNLDEQIAIELVLNSFLFIKDFNQEIYGLSAVECGNYLEHDLEQAKKDVLPVIEVLKNYSKKDLLYK
jgi:S-ribosylhomocysteine lyase